jgi:bifunctional non-homologous end joining protein LigD
MKTESSDILRIDGHEIKLTRPDKVLFPEDGITKAGLIHYYERVGPLMLPYLSSRPLTLQRFPDGIDQTGFIQKSTPQYYPRWIATATMKKSGGTVRHVVCDRVATLVYLANQACITPHVWLSRADKPDFPDQMIFDFDPSTDDISTVIEGAESLKGLLDELELPAFVKSTGSRGLHVAVPLNGEADFESVRTLARALAEIVAARAPAKFTLEQYKRKRHDRVFIDINRNAYAQTAVANYAVRARRGAPVAVPLQWSELRRRGFRPDGVTLRTIEERLEESRDPWKGFWQHPASLGNVTRKLEKLHAA